jgi:hypothetical protein
MGRDMMNENWEIVVKIRDDGFDLYEVGYLKRAKHFPADKGVGQWHCVNVYVHEDDAIEHLNIIQARQRREQLQDWCPRRKNQLHHMLLTMMNSPHLEKSGQVLLNSERMATPYNPDRKVFVEYVRASSGEDVYITVKLEGA